MENLEINLNREYILAGDISISMSTIDQKCAQVSRYKYMLEKFKSFIQIACDYDNHEGVTVFLFGQNIHKYEHVKLDDVTEVLDKVILENLTMTDMVIDEAYIEHLEEKQELRKEGKEHTGSILMIFTDGEPTNREAVKRSIQVIANNISKADEFEIIFLTVGTISSSLMPYLHNLNDGLKYPIVTIKELDKVNFLSAVVS